MQLHGTVTKEMKTLLYQDRRFLMRKIYFYRGKSDIVNKRIAISMNYVFMLNEQQANLVFLLIFFIINFQRRPIISFYLSVNFKQTDGHMNC